MRIISLWIFPLEARMSAPNKSNWLPFVSVTSPPASFIMSAPAAISHGFKLNSQYPSKRPHAM